MNPQRKVIILKIGGSILSPSEEKIFDIERAKLITNSLLELKDSYQFVICTGGGFLARKYQQIVREAGHSNKSINWVGASACSHNAVTLHAILEGNVEPVPLIGEPVEETTPITFSETFLCVGTATPGHSSDLDAILMANRTGSKTIISLKDVDGVFDKDPDLHTDAKMFNNLSWDDYSQKILKTEVFTPKMAVPVDPIATKLAIENKIDFIILNGKNVPNVINAISNSNFVGTLISNNN